MFGGTKKINSKTTYGLASWRNPHNGNGEVFVTQENTTNLAKLMLTDAGGGKVSYQKVASLVCPTTSRLPNGTDLEALLQPEAPRLGGARRGHGASTRHGDAVG